MSFHSTSSIQAMSERSSTFIVAEAFPLFASVTLIFRPFFHLSFSLFSIRVCFVSFADLAVLLEAFVFFVVRRSVILNRHSSVWQFGKGILQFSQFYRKFAFSALSKTRVSYVIVTFQQTLKT